MTTTSTTIAGTEPGQRWLNGPQTTARTYRNLSAPPYAVARGDDAIVNMRDGGELLADVYRPNAPGRYPALIAASPYPRQIQNLGAPLGFIDTGASNFFVSRGYVHVIANCRAPAARVGPSASSTAGNGATYTTWSNGQPRNPGPTAMSAWSAWSASAISGEKRRWLTQSGNHLVSRCTRPRYKP